MVLLHEKAKSESPGIPIRHRFTTVRHHRTRRQRSLAQPQHADPVSHIFTILPNVDTPTLLCHACETLASLNVLITDLACNLESSNRNVALSIQQLAVVGELLVNRALDNIDPPEGVPIK
jgi:hypothetical protein